MPSATAQDFEAYFDAPLAEFLADRIPKAAAKARRRFPEVSAPDFEQAMWAKALTKAPYFRKLWANSQQGAIWSELRREGTKVGSEDDRYRRTQAAAAAGYSVYDIEFYSTGVIELILPALIAADFDVSVAMESATAGTDTAGVHIGRNDPHATAESHETYMCVLIDLTAAYRRLPEGMQRLIRTYYNINQEDTDEGRWDREKLASSMGLTAAALRQRVHRSVLRLRDELGGNDPWLHR